MYYGGMSEDVRQMPDEEILRSALQDPSYFSVLVDRYQAAFLRKALGIFRNPLEAEDAVQDTFLRIYKYGHKFKKEDGIAFKSWAYKILMNTSFTRYQDLKKKIANEDYLDPLIHSEMTADDGVDLATISDAKQTVKEVIQKMPEHFARLLHLYYLEDKSYKDICTIEKISLPALKMRLFRAKKMFQKLSSEA